MTKNIKQVEVTETSIIYNLPDIKMLKDGLISNLKWPEDKSYLFFNLSAKDTRTKQPIKTIVSTDKYSCRLNYLSPKNRIHSFRAPEPLRTLKLQPFKSLEEIKKMTIWSHGKYFLARYKQYLSPNHAAETKKYLTNLKKVKSVAIIYKNKCAGMVSLMKIVHATSLPKPLHWVTWIWIDNKLPEDARRYAHSLVRSWLIKNSSKYIGASVNAVNIRSQKWFLKMGFRPVRVFFEKM